MSRTEEIVRDAGQYWLPVYRPRHLVLERGCGARVWDIEGREFIDFAAGIAVNALGHGDADLHAALIAQADKLWHVSNVFHSEPPVRLAQALVESAPFARRAFLCNSGTEANEAAIKLARRWAANAGRPPERRVIVSFAGGFHGRTLAAVTATAQAKYRQGYEPLPGGFRHCPFNDPAALEQAMAAGDVAAVLLEPIQGEGGVHPAAPGFLAAVRALCDRHDALLVFDEIQCGMGRSGRLYAHEWTPVQPDVMTLAKALGCGFPIGAMLVGERAAEVMQFGAHGSTFGGNPLAAAVALVALRKLAAPALHTHVLRQGGVLRAALEQIQSHSGVFADVRGRGLMLGAQLAADYAGRAGEILDLAAAHGLLLLQAGPDVLRFVPPLTIDDGELAEGMRRLDAAIAEFVRSAGAAHAQ